MISIVERKKRLATTVRRYKNEGYSYSQIAYKMGYDNPLTIRIILMEDCYERI